MKNYNIYHGADLNNVPRTMPPTAGFTPEGSLNRHPLTATMYTYIHTHVYIIYAACSIYM